MLVRFTKVIYPKGGLSMFYRKQKSWFIGWEAQKVPTTEYTQSLIEAIVANLQTVKRASRASLLIENGQTFICFDKLSTPNVKRIRIKKPS